MMTDTPVELMLSRIPDAKRSGKGFVARCPAHDDRRPSLSINEGDDGRALLHCHAGCTVEAICKALGLRVADLMPHGSVDTDTNRSHPKKTAIVSTPTPKKARVFATANTAVAELEQQLGKRSAQWTYLDADGNPVGVILRWNRPDGKDMVATSGSR
ncbi:MAG: hypothetical protein HQ567_32405 [Candidatus Nealsonbacteria bacterium]|nr:hypothetical protein [Candidatus Nealsonbacteria bacterium]